MVEWVYWQMVYFMLEDVHVNESLTNVVWSHNILNPTMRALQLAMQNDPSLPWVMDSSLQANHE